MMQTGKVSRTHARPDIWPSKVWFHKMLLMIIVTKMTFLEFIKDKCEISPLYNVHAGGKYNKSYPVSVAGEMR